MRYTFLILLIVLCAARPAVSQIRDDFSDGDLFADPTWSGDVERWQIGTLAGSPALQSNGAAHSDTIHLALTTDAAFGRWEFTFAHRRVNLSTFNGARIFLSVDRPDPSGPMEGYFVQLGTNNSDRVSLWRVDGGLDKRVELGRSLETLMAGDSSMLTVAVERDAGSGWIVYVDGKTVVEATDARYTSGRHFIVWVKHTAQGAGSFYFDDLTIEPAAIDPPRPEPNPYLPGWRDIVINEVQFDPLPGSSEFVEVFNRSDSTIDLMTLTFRDSRSPPLEVADSTHLLEPGHFGVIVADHDAFETQFRRTPYVSPSRWAALNNGGDSFVIEAGGQIVDSLSYGDDASPTGFSLERIDPEGPSELYNFTASRAPFGATPGAINSTYEPDVSGPRLLFAEQKDVSTRYLHFDEPLDASVFSIDNVRFGSERPDSIAVVDDRTLAAFLSAQSVSSTVDIYGARDRQGNVTERLSIDIAFLPRERDLVVNEIMFEPLTDAFDGYPNQSEYVEILNRSDRHVTLSGLVSTRRPDELGNADTLDISLPLTGLAPGAFYVIIEDTSLLSQLSEARRLVTSALTLPNGGGVFSLRHESGASVDSVTYERAHHHPDLLESRGVALERVDADGDSTDPENWTSSVDPSGGTPGRSNSIRLQARPPSMASGISVTPNPFSPNRDGVDDVAAIDFQLPSNVSLARVRIFDRRGYLVRELVRTQLVGGTGTFYWDGSDDLGRRLRIGVYIIFVEAFDSRQHAVEAFKTAVVLAR